MTHSLDPKNWSAFRQRAHAMLDAAIDHMEGYTDGPVWTPPDTADTSISKDPLGENGTDDRLKALLPYGVGNTHPRFLGWVHGAGTPSGLIADMMTSAINANCGGRYHAAIEVERELIRWALNLFEFPDTGSGLITTGTSMATVIALKAARDHALSFESRKAGLTSTPRLVGFTSAGGHNCLSRSFDLLGLGADALISIPLDDHGRMDVSALRSAIADCRDRGERPFTICATAGTVNRGAIDPLDDIASFAAEESLWFHVDAAFAAALKLSPQHAVKLSGLDKADSMAFDFHKWMQVNYDAGCVLLRDEKIHRRSFSDRPAYLTAATEGLAAGNPWPVEYGPELSRGFRALKVWAQIQEFGAARLGQVVDANISQAAYLANRVSSSDPLELLSYDGLNICCFRYTRPGLSEAELDSFNERLVIALQMDGVAAPSTTRIGEKLAIRVNITNHRTRHEDMDILLQAVLAFGRDL